MLQVVSRLAAAKVGKITIEIEEDIVKNGLLRKETSIEENVVFCINVVVKAKSAGT